MSSFLRSVYKESKIATSFQKQKPTTFPSTFGISQISGIPLELFLNPQNINQFGMLDLGPYSWGQKPHIGHVRLATKGRLFGIHSWVLCMLLSKPHLYWFIIGICFHYHCSFHCRLVYSSLYWLTLYCLISAQQSSFSFPYPIASPFPYFYFLHLCGPPPLLIVFIN